MPNNSIEKDLIDSLIRVIKEITTANGFDIDLNAKAVDDVYYDYDDAVYSHYVIVLPDESNPEDRTAKQTKNIFSWEILVGIKPSDSAKDERYSFPAYIRDEIMKQGKRDDGTGKMLASWTKIDKTIYRVAQADKSAYYLAQINGRCSTHHSVTNYTNE